jgi:hypothetical protein
MEVIHMENQQQNIEYRIEEQDVEKASSTWSGFVYQGKIAIYAVLKYINQLYPKIDEIKRLSLEIEYLEDFSILRDGEHVSIHQVKAKPTTNTIGSYNEANLNLLGKLAKYNSIQEASLHTAVKIKEFTKDDVSNNLKSFNVANKKEELGKYKTKLFEDGKFDEVYSKLKISCNDGIVPMERVIELKEIKNLIINELKVFYLKWDTEKIREKNGSQENVNHIYSNLTYLIEDKVHKDHAKILIEEKIIIKFEDILNILEHQSVFNYSQSTVSSLLLHQLVDDFDEYCSCYGISEENVELKETWLKHLIQLKKFHPSDFLMLCRKLTPNIILQNKDILGLEEYKNIMQTDGVVGSFFNGLNHFNDKLHEPKNVQNAYELLNDGVRYLLTTINKSGPVAHNIVGKKIYENLSNDETMFKMLYEIDSYINSNIEEKYTGNIVHVKEDLGSEVVQEEDLKQTITSQKTINFVKVDTVKETLLRS